MKKSSRVVSILGVALVMAMPGLALGQQAAGDNDSEVANLMHDRLDRITTIRANIIQGNLAGVQEPANWLAGHENVEGLPEAFEPFVETLRTYAQEILAAPDLDTAAMTVSQMAQNCGNCHTANQIDLEFGFDEVPDEWSDTQTHMQRHQWAVDRLWEGLIGPSEAAWTRGTTMLVDDPLHSDDLMDESSGGDAAALEDITTRVHKLGAQGAGARTADERSKLYGEIIGLCASCHSTLGRGPGN